MPLLLILPSPKASFYTPTDLFMAAALNIKPYNLWWTYSLYVAPCPVCNFPAYNALIRGCCQSTQHSEWQLPLLAHAATELSYICHRFSMGVLAAWVSTIARQQCCRIVQVKALSRSDSIQHARPSLNQNCSSFLSFFLSVLAPMFSPCLLRCACLSTH